MNNSGTSSRVWSFSPTRVSRLARQISHFGHQVKHHVSRIAAIARVVCGVLGYRVGFVGALSLVAVAARGGALLSLLLFVKHALDETSNLPQWAATIHFGASTPLWSGGLCLFMFVIGALASFYCGRLAALYAVKCVDELIVNRLGRALAQSNRLERDMIAAPLTASSVQLARLIRRLLDLPLGVLTLGLSVGFLLVISVPVTLLLFLLLPAILVPLFFLNRNVARENREMRYIKHAVRTAQKTTLDAILDQPDEASIKTSLTSYVKDPHVERRNQILVQIWTLRHRVLFVSQLFSNAILVIFAFGLPLFLNVARDFAAEMLGFVVALRYLLQAVQDVSSRLTVITRFLEPAECLLNPHLASQRFPTGDENGIDDDATFDM